MEKTVDNTTDTGFIASDDYYSIFKKNLGFGTKNEPSNFTVNENNPYPNQLEKAVLWMTKNQEYTTQELSEAVNELVVNASIEQKLVKLDVGVVDVVRTLSSGRTVNNKMLTINGVETNTSVKDILGDIDGFDISDFAFYCESDEAKPKKFVRRDGSERVDNVFGSVQIVSLKNDIKDNDSGEYMLRQFFPTIESGDKPWISSWNVHNANRLVAINNLYKVTKKRFEEKGGAIDVAGLERNLASPFDTEIHKIEVARNELADGTRPLSDYFVLQQGSFVNNRLSLDDFYENGGFSSDTSIVSAALACSKLYVSGGKGKPILIDEDVIQKIKKVRDESINGLDEISEMTPEKEQGSIAFLFKDRLKRHSYGKSTKFDTLYYNAKGWRAGVSVPRYGVVYALDSFKAQYDEFLNYKLMNDYEKELDSDYAKPFMTKKNINKSTQAAMENSSFYQNGFKYVEFDNDVDLGSIGTIEAEWANYFYSFPEVPFEQPDIRFRKLGNYRSAGIFFPGANSIAIDGNSIYSLTHEYAHYLDYHFKPGKNLSMDDDFMKIVDTYRNRIDELDHDSYVYKHKGYFSTPTEVFARAFELYKKSQENDDKNMFLAPQKTYDNETDYQLLNNGLKELAFAYFDKVGLNIGKESIEKEMANNGVEQLEASKITQTNEGTKKVQQPTLPDSSLQLFSLTWITSPLKTSTQNDEFLFSESYSNHTNQTLPLTKSIADFDKPNNKLQLKLGLKLASYKLPKEYLDEREQENTELENNKNNKRPYLTNLLFQNSEVTMFIPGSTKRDFYAKKDGRDVFQFAAPQNNAPDSYFDFSKALVVPNDVDFELTNGNVLPIEQFKYLQDNRSRFVLQFMNSMNDIHQAYIHHEDENVQNHSKYQRVSLFQQANLLGWDVERRKIDEGLDLSESLSAVNQVLSPDTNLVWQLGGEKPMNVAPDNDLDNSGIEETEHEVSEGLYSALRNIGTEQVLNVAGVGSVKYLAVFGHDDAVISVTSGFDDGRARSFNGRIVFDNKSSKYRLETDSRQADDFVLVSNYLGLKEIVESSDFLSAYVNSWNEYRRNANARNGLVADDGILDSSAIRLEQVDIPGEKLANFQDISFHDKFSSIDSVVEYELLKNREGTETKSIIDLLSEQSSMGDSELGTLIKSMVDDYYDYPTGDVFIHVSENGMQVTSSSALLSSEHVSWNHVGAVANKLLTDKGLVYQPEQVIQNGYAADSSDDNVDARKDVLESGHNAYLASETFKDEFQKVVESGNASTFKMATQENEVTISPNFKFNGDVTYNVSIGDSNIRINVNQDFAVNYQVFLDHNWQEHDEFLTFGISHYLTTNEFKASFVNSWNSWRKAENISGGRDENDGLYPEYVDSYPIKKVTDGWLREKFSTDTKLKLAMLVHNNPSLSDSEIGQSLANECNKEKIHLAGSKEDAIYGISSEESYDVVIGVDGLHFAATTAEVPNSFLSWDEIGGQLKNLIINNEYFVDYLGKNETSEFKKLLVGSIDGTLDTVSEDLNKRLQNENLRSLSVPIKYDNGISLTSDLLFKNTIFWDEKKSCDFVVHQDVDGKDIVIMSGNYDSLGVNTASQIKGLLEAAYYTFNPTSDSKVEEVEQIEDTHDNSTNEISDDLPVSNLNTENFIASKIDNDDSKSLFLHGYLQNRKGVISILDRVIVTDNLGQEKIYNADDNRFSADELAMMDKKYVRWATVYNYDGIEKLEYNVAHREYELQQKWHKGDLNPKFYEENNLNVFSPVTEVASNVVKQNESVITPNDTKPSENEKEMAISVDDGISNDVSANNVTQYWYELMQRPVGLGAQPKGFIAKNDDKNDKYGAVAYSNKLDLNEIANYDLKYIGSGSDYDSAVANSNISDLNDKVLNILSFLNEEQWDLCFDALDVIHDDPNRVDKVTAGFMEIAKEQGEPISTLLSDYLELNELPLDEKVVNSLQKYEQTGNYHFVDLANEYSYGGLVKYSDNLIGLDKCDKVMKKKVQAVLEEFIATEVKPGITVGSIIKKNNLQIDVTPQQDDYKLQTLEHFMNAVKKSKVDVTSEELKNLKNWYLSGNKNVDGLGNVFSDIPSLGNAKQKLEGKRR
ncbi:hypothetical protein EQG49_13360 [Periweissella cryptocerci]|uniref:Uncharacterized protein n=1 Tax=Periweissella cryptocerci TaxID=2506420 RepID=A0A4V1AJ11_9LACO|nr:LPD1 domain-containing protein [Periweissella cryptocerci]QBO37385.1 hypothetical protein EQG49_13360 [Periweissella cryptocerci]